MDAGKGNQRYFGIDTPLNAKTAEDIYERANAAMAKGDFRPQSLITKSNVKVVCTTDDPFPDLLPSLLPPSSGLPSCPQTQTALCVNHFGKQSREGT